MDNLPLAAWLEVSSSAPLSCPLILAVMNGSTMPGVEGAGMMRLNGVGVDAMVNMSSRVLVEILGAGRLDEASTFWGETQRFGGDFSSDPLHGEREFSAPLGLAKSRRRALL